MIIVCKHCGEEKEIKGRGLCKKCYQSLKRKGKLEEYPKITTITKSICKIEGCQGRIKAHGLCAMHYMQLRRTGELKENTYSQNQNDYLTLEKFILVKRNEFVIGEKYSEIVLYDENNKEVRRVIIDTEDIEILNTHFWKIDRDLYLYANYKSLRIHDLLMNNLNGEFEVDHINRNPLDNRKENLRLCNSQQNKMNRGLRRDNKSGITGVYYDKKSNKWKSQICYNNNQKISLGLYEDFDEAVCARLKAEQKYFGDFSPQKHLFEEYGVS